MGTINGRAYDFTSLAVKSGVLSLPFESIDYENPREIGKVFSNTGRKRARTRGKSDASGAISMLEEDANPFLEWVTSEYGGIYEAETLPFTVTYGNNNQTVVTDKLIDCTILNVSKSYSEGVDGLVVNIDLDIMKIILGSTKFWADD